MSNATQNQVGGDHYSRLKIQPMILAYIINASPCFFNVSKYITREKDNMIGQIDKAMHCIELEEELIDDISLYGMTMNMYKEVIPIPYYDAIAQFSIQFKHSSYISDVLLYVHDGQYDMAKAKLRLLRYEVMKDNCWRDTNDK